MTPAQKQAVERVREDIACLEQDAGYSARFGTPSSKERRRWNRDFAADLRTLLALLDEQREALRPFAAIAGPIKGEVGRPTYLDEIMRGKGTEELAVTTVFDTGGRGAVLWADHFRRAAALTEEPS